MKIKALIVEDEINNQKLIEKYLTAYCPYIHIIGLTTGVNDTLAFLENNKPEVAFMDISLTDGNAFDLLAKLNDINFEIIFITSHEKYAIQAFRLHALDYILKPVNPDDLIKCCKLLRDKKLNSIEKLKHLVHNTGEAPKIAIHSFESIDFVEIKHIIRLESDENYTRLFTASGKPYLSSKSIKYYEELLEPFGFFRVHKSHVINTAYIVSVNKNDSGNVVVRDNTDIPIARRRKQEFLDFLAMTFKG
ncbi:MAG: Sensory transduction protein LytR [Bacteroidetes bacterium ADurb.Bin408]|nr:MAG: Sensory transduction protein LytR [Bacteroidetes bacterium ADurb.Bin408]